MYYHPIWVLYCLLWRMQWSLYPTHVAKFPNFAIMLWCAHLSSNKKSYILSFDHVKELTKPIKWNFCTDGLKNEPIWDLPTLKCHITFVDVVNYRINLLTFWTLAFDSRSRFFHLSFLTIVSTLISLLLSCLALVRRKNINI